jgi:hypothetical protein
MRRNDEWVSQIMIALEARCRCEAVVPRSVPEARAKIRQSLTEFFLSALDGGVVGVGENLGESREVVALEVELVAVTLSENWSGMNIALKILPALVVVSEEPRMSFCRL